MELGIPTPFPKTLYPLTTNLMKLNRLTFLFVAILPVLTGCSSSDPEPPLSAEEAQIQKLSKTWILGTVMYDGDNISDRFNDFELTFKPDKTYTATGALGDFDFEPFKATGSWDFKNGDLNQLIRNDGVDMTTEVTENTLSLSFTISEANGRVAGLGGYQFDLVFP